MKKYLASFLTLMICLGSLSAVLAAPAINDLTSGVAGGAGYNTKVDQYELSRTIGRVIKAAMSLIGIVFLALTVYAGFLWMTAGGNEDAVTKAKNIMTRSVIGLIIVLSAYGITVFVATMMTSSDSSGFWGAFSNNGFNQGRTTN